VLNRAVGSAILRALPTVGEDLKLNIFRVEELEVAGLRDKLSNSGMVVIHSEDQAGWSSDFYFSRTPEPRRIPWVTTFAPYFEDIALPQNLTHFAVFLFVKGDSAYALSYGKSHFYIRPFSSYDFGIDLAKRIADEDDTKQTASRRFQGRRKKDIKSYASNTRLDVESGESIDLLQAAIVSSRHAAFGKTGKFGVSALLAPDIGRDKIGGFLDEIETALKEPERFKLPRTTIINEPLEVEKLDSLLVAELRSDLGTTDFAQNTFDLYGVDFVFSSEGESDLKAPRHPRKELEALTIKDLKAYIQDQSLTDDEILKMRVTHRPEEGPTYSSGLKEVLDFIVDTEKVVLTGGHWMHFNQDYLDYLDAYVRSIEVEPTEPEFLEIWSTEPAFNSSAELLTAGYALADKDFDILRTSSSTAIEAWDLSKQGTVYAVKFGTAQKLGYVCDQAIAVLELLRNQANVKTIPGFDRYCLWIGYRGKHVPKNLADSGSIIFKQKLEAWARKSRELGVVPVLKISHKLRVGIDN
jgi:uncharacterized protein (TIGR04141 family)